MQNCVEISQLWWQWHPPVGAFIAVLAVLGVLVPLYREWGKIGPREKAVWTAMMFMLLLLELRTLYLDRDEHDREQAFARCEELRSFTQIATTLGSAISSNQEHFNATMSKLEDTLNTETGERISPMLKYTNVKIIAA